LEEAALGTAAFFGAAFFGEAALTGAAVGLAAAVFVVAAFFGAVAAFEPVTFGLGMGLFSLKVNYMHLRTLIYIFFASVNYLLHIFVENIFLICKIFFLPHWKPAKQRFWIGSYDFLQAKKSFAYC